MEYGGGGTECINLEPDDNLIIKGNNLIALSSLLKRYENKVKCIYIDPPYNTGNDSFNYNDNFNHSTWLTFMKNRLELAKKLLADDGVIFVQCDDNEQAYLKVLMDDIFEMGNFVNCIAVKMSESKGLKNAHIEKKLPKIKEYILIYSKNTEMLKLNIVKIKKEEDELKKYIKYYNKYIPNINENIKKWKLEKFNNKLDKIEYSDKLVYLVKPDNDLKIKIEKNEFQVIINNKGNRNIYYNLDGNIKKVLILSENLESNLNDLWYNISTININKEGGGAPILTNAQKPEFLIERIVELATKENDLVLDFHLGSGTTCAVAHKMNRRYIGIEQMDYIEDIAVERMKKVIAGEQGGISKAVNWNGGGSFVYCELLENAKILIDEIEESTENNIDEIKNKIYKDERIIPYITREELEKIDDEFQKLNLDEKKKGLCELIDKNKLYVNYSDIDDENYNISEQDKKFTKSFYEDEVK